MVKGDQQIHVQSDFQQYCQKNFTTEFQISINKILATSTYCYNLTVNPGFYDDTSPKFLFSIPNTIVRPHITNLPCLLETYHQKLQDFEYATDLSKTVSASVRKPKKTMSQGRKESNIEYQLQTVSAKM